MLEKELLETGRPEKELLETGRPEERLEAPHQDQRDAELDQRLERDVSDTQSTAAGSRAPRRWTRLLRRFGIAVLAVAAVPALWNRVNGDDGPTPPRPPAVTTSLKDTVAQLEAATRARPEDPQAWQKLGDGYVQRSIETLDPAFADLALKAYDRSDALAANPTGTRLGRAGLAATQHRFSDALVLANQVLTTDPYSAAALSIRFDAEIELGRYGDAELHLQDMLDRRPGAPALARASYLRELSGDLDGVLAAISQAETAALASTSIERATLASVHGDVLVAAGRYADAGRAYARALGLDPNLPSALVGRARVTAVRGDRTGAIDQLQRLVRRTPLPNAAILLADLQTAAGRPADAKRSVELVRALVELQAASGSAVDLDLASFEAEYGAVTNDSVDRARRAFDARPSVHAADTLAWTLYHSGDVTGAVSYSDLALRIGSRDSAVLFHAATIYTAAGDPARARGALQRAADANPWFSFSRQPDARSLARQLDVDWPTGRSS